MVAKYQRINTVYALLILIGISCFPRIIVSVSLPPGMKTLPPRNDRALAFRIDSAKSEFIYREPIEVAFWLENTGNSIEYYWSGEALELIVADVRENKHMSCRNWLKSMVVIETDSTGRLSSSDLHQIGPSEHTPRYFQDLLSTQWYGKTYLCGDLPPGTYKLYGSGFVTDTVYIHIHEPEDEYDKEAVGLLDESLIPNVRYRLVPPRNSQKLLELVEQFPKSPLAPRALGELLRFKGDTAATAAIRLISDYQTSTYAVEAVSLLNVDKLRGSETRKVRRGLEFLRSKYSELAELVGIIDSKLQSIGD